MNRGHAKMSRATAISSQYLVKNPGYGFSVWKFGLKYVGNHLWLVSVVSLIEGVDRVSLNRSSQTAVFRISIMQVRHSNGMRIFVGNQLSFCKHVLFVSSDVEHVFEINVHTCTLISSHLCHFNAPTPSHWVWDTLYLKPSFKV